MSKAKKQIDWPGIERDYVKTDLSIREIARWYGCSDKAIRLRAKAGGWARPGAEPPQASPQGPQPPSEVVEPIVERIRTPLNSDTTKPEAIIGRGRILALRMLDELDATTSHIGEMEDAIEEANPGKSGMRRREAMMKAVSLPVRAGTLKNLALAVKTLAETLAPAGKKAAAAEEARIAGQGSDWGDDLAPPDARPN
jgi:hypothetical protein